MSAALISASGLASGYGGRPVVRDLDLEVHAGEVVVLLGPNGAGKTTTLLTLAGELTPLAGEVAIGGVPATTPLHRRARRGLSFVTEERSVFMRLTVAENLRISGSDAARAYALFPELEPLRDRRGGLLSGGEQQMLALAKALTRATRVLLADELSLGLAPLIVERLLRAVRAAADTGEVGVLLVEQHVGKALDIADRGYVLSRGRVALAGSAAQLRARLDEVEHSYFDGTAT